MTQKSYMDFVFSIFQMLYLFIFISTFLKGLLIILLEKINLWKTAYLALCLQPPPKKKQTKKTVGLLLRAESKALWELERNEKMYKTMKKNRIKTSE